MHVRRWWWANPELYGTSRRSPCRVAGGAQHSIAARTDAVGAFSDHHGASKLRRRVARTGRLGLAAGLRAEALQVRNPHHGQPVAERALDHLLHVMLRRRDVI